MLRLWMWLHLWVRSVQVLFPQAHLGLRSGGPALVCDCIKDSTALYRELVSNRMVIINIIISPIEAV